MLAEEKAQVDRHGDKRQRDADRTRAEILKVARREFVGRGFSGARVDAIAAKTATSKRMLYYYFGDKEGLYLEVLRDAYFSIREAERALDLDIDDPVAALRSLVRFSVRHNFQDPDYVRLIMVENIHHGRFLEQLDEVMVTSRDAITQIDDIYRKGRDAGKFRRGLNAIDIHWAISAVSFFSVSNQATFGMLFDRKMDETGVKATEQLAEDMVMRFVLDQEG